MGTNEQKGHQKPESLSCRDALNCTGTEAGGGHWHWQGMPSRACMRPDDLNNDGQTLALRRLPTACRRRHAAHGNKPSESHAVGYARRRRSGNLRLGRSPARPNKTASRCPLAVLLHCTVTPRRSGRNREKMDMENRGGRGRAGSAHGPRHSNLVRRASTAGMNATLGEAEACSVGGCPCLPACFSGSSDEDQQATLAIDF